MSEPTTQKLLPAASLVLAVLGLGLCAAGGGVAPFQGALLGLALALLAVFAVIWILGIRYPDVGWMVVVIALAEVSAAYPAHGVTRAALVAGIGALLITFYRVSFRPGRLEAIFLAAAALMAGGGAALPGGLAAALPSYVLAVLLGYAAVHGALLMRPLPPTRRRYVGLVALTCATGALTYVVAARAEFSPEALLRTDFSLVTAFALFVVADLVVFHRSYYREKASRIAAAERGDLEARLELGRSVQELLLSKERDGRFGEFTYEFHFQPAASKGGDWFYAWERGTEKRFFVGEVFGRGAQAGLAVAAVIGFLHESRARGLDLLGTARYVNQRLGDVFNRQITTTLMAVSADRDGTVELLNCGGPGFFAVSRDGCRHWALGSTPLGAGESFEAEQCPVPLTDGDILFAGNGGVLGPEATDKVLAHFEEEMDLALEASVIRTAVLKVAAPGAHADQTLLTLQKRVA